MKIALLGDIGLLGNYSMSKNPHLLNNLSTMQGFLSQFDLVIGNLETPFSIKKKTHGAKSSYICADPTDIEILKYLGIDVVTIANNHMFDFGKEGFETTIKTLEDAGIEWFGANGKYYKVEQDNNKMLFNGFCCYSSNPLHISKEFGKYGINPFHLIETANLLTKSSKKGYLNIFAIHSGIEHVNTPSIEQIRAAHMLADIAPFVWYGHHPHVVQGIENIQGSLIAHSLGNFCFSGNKSNPNRPIIELSENNRIGMIVILEIKNNIIISHSHQLIHIGENGTLSLLKDNTIINDYSVIIEKLEEDHNLYKLNRLRQRNIYLSQRKELRNLTWVLKRIRPRYARLLLENKLNSKKYHKSIIKPLKDKGYEL